MNNEEQIQLYERKMTILKFLDQDHYKLPKLNKPINYCSDIPDLTNEQFLNVISILNGTFNQFSYFDNQSLYRFVIMYKIGMINKIMNCAGFDEQFDQWFISMLYGANELKCPVCCFILGFMSNNYLSDDEKETYLSSSINMNYRSAIFYKTYIMLVKFNDKYGDCTLNDLIWYDQNIPQFKKQFEVALEYISKLLEYDDNIVLELYNCLNLKNINTIEDIYQFINQCVYFFNKYDSFD